MHPHAQVFGLYVRCGVMRAMTELGTMASPTLLNQLMKCIADKDNWIASAGQHSPYEGYALAAMMFVAAVLTSISVS